MFAPQSSNSRVVACLSASDTGGAGSGSRADAPPEMRQITRSPGPACCAICAMRAAPRAPFGPDRMAGFVQLDAAQAGGFAGFDVHQAGGNPGAEQSFDGPGHLRPSFPRPDHINVLECVQAIALASGEQVVAFEASGAEARLRRGRSLHRSVKDTEGLPVQGRCHGPSVMWGGQSCPQPPF